MAFFMKECLKRALRIANPAQQMANVYAIQDIIKASAVETSKIKPHFADVMSQSMIPTKDSEKTNGDCGVPESRTYKIGGLIWNLKEGQTMDDYSVFWIGPDNSAFSNVVLTFNTCDIGT